MLCKFPNEVNIVNAALPVFANLRVAITAC